MRIKHPVQDENDIYQARTATLASVTIALHSAYPDAEAGVPFDLRSLLDRLSIESDNVAAL